MALLPRTSQLELARLPALPNFISALRSVEAGVPPFFSGYVKHVLRRMFTFCDSGRKCSREEKRLGRVVGEVEVELLCWRLLLRGSGSEYGRAICGKARRRVVHRIIQLKFDVEIEVLQD